MKTGPLHAVATEGVRTIDMTTVMLDLDDVPLKDDSGLIYTNLAELREGLEKAPVLTLGRAVANALNSRAEDTVTADEKWARAALARQVRDSKSTALSAEEIAKVKQLGGKVWSGVVIAQAFPLLDPNARKPELK